MMSAHRFGWNDNEALFISKQCLSTASIHDYKMKLFFYLLAIISMFF